MANFGSDFQVTQPSDAEFARTASGTQGATRFRDLKDRIKSFFGTLFDLETGLFRDGVVPSSALKSLSPSPAGSGYREVEVDDRGRVVSGRTTPSVAVGLPAVYRGVFYGNTNEVSGYESPDGFIEVPAVGIPGQGAALFDEDFDGAFSGNLGGHPHAGLVGNCYKYSLTLPTNITRVRYFISGRPDDQGTAPVEPAPRSGYFDVRPGEAINIWVATVDAAGIAGGNYTCSMIQHGYWEGNREDLPKYLQGTYPVGYTFVDGTWPLFVTDSYAFFGPWDIDGGRFGETEPTFPTAAQRDLLGWGIIDSAYTHGLPVPGSFLGPSLMGPGGIGRYPSTSISAFPYAQRHALWRWFEQRRLAAISTVDGPFGGTVILEWVAPS